MKRLLPAKELEIVEDGRVLRIERQRRFELHLASGAGEFPRSMQE